VPKENTLHQEKKRYKGKDLFRKMASMQQAAKLAPV